MMTIEEIKDKSAPILQQAGVTKSSLFGSVATGSNTNSSDIDLLVDLPRGNTLFDFIDLKLTLEEALGSKVDLVEFDAIKPIIRERILKEQVPIL